MKLNKLIPEGKKGASLLIIGEFPGETDMFEGKTFAGTSGNKLFEVLNNFGITREDVYMMNVSMYRPLSGNVFDTIPSIELEESLNVIKDYIEKYPPNCILALGEYALRVLTGRFSISNHRGSVLPYLYNESIKVYPTYAPSYILKDPSNYFLFHFDLKRAVQQSEKSEFPYKTRDYIIVDQNNINQCVTEILSAPLLAVDIETTKKGKVPICVGFAVSDTKAYSIPWDNFTYTYIKEILEREDIAKIFHFGFCFDIEVLYLSDIEVKGQIEDTFILSHAIDPRLPRGLDFLASIYTYEPYYKTSGRATLPGDTKAWGEKLDKKEIYIYNAKDCAVTMEIFNAMKAIIEPADLDTYEFDLQDAYLAQKVGRIGMPVSETNRNLLMDAVIFKWKSSQIILNSIAGKNINVGSSVQMPKLLYESLELPIKKRKGKVTTDDRALVELLSWIQDKIDSVSKQTTKDMYRVKLGLVQLIRNIRGYRKLKSSYLDAKTNEGRFKSIFNSAGTDFGRWSGSKYIDDTGVNPQTWPRADFPLPDHAENLEAFKQQLAKEFSEEIEE